MATKPLETLSEADAEAIRESLLIGNPNAPLGFVQPDAEGNILATSTHRIGTDAEIGALVLALGEFAFTTDTKELRYGDGSTSGGLFISGGARFATDVAFSVTSTEQFMVPISVYAGRTYHFKCLAKYAAAVIGRLILSTGTFSDYVDNTSFPGFGLGRAMTAIIHPLSGSFTLPNVQQFSSTSSIDIQSAGNATIHVSGTFRPSADASFRFGYRHGSVTTGNPEVTLEIQRVA